MNVRAENATFAAFRWTLLRPVEFAILLVDGDADAPMLSVLPILAFAGDDQRLDITAYWPSAIMPACLNDSIYSILLTIEIRAHDLHTLPVTPVELLTPRRNNALLRCMHSRRSGRHDSDDILAVNIAAMDRSIVGIAITHISPPDVFSIMVYGDSIGNVFDLANYGFHVRTVSLARNDTALVIIGLVLRPAHVEEEEAASVGCCHG